MLQTDCRLFASMGKLNTGMSTKKEMVKVHWGAKNAHFSILQKRSYEFYGNAFPRN